MRTHSIQQRRRHVVATALVSAIAALALCSAALAAKGTWYDVPNWGSADADAIIDSGGNTYTGGSARGRVQFNAGGYCRRVQYAPYANFALDGGWNNLPTYCDSTRRTLDWSDTYHLSYDGFKFRICGNTGCGSVRYVSY